MKLISFIVRGRPSFGAVKDNGVVDLGARMAGCTTLRQLLEAGRLAEAAKLTASAAPDHPLDKISFAPVIPDPGKIICVGLNYRDHVAETGAPSPRSRRCLHASPAARWAISSRS